MSENSFIGKRIMTFSVRKYCLEAYPDFDQFALVRTKQVSKVEPFLQADYGDINDCTLTSISTLLYWMINKKKSFQSVYDIVYKYGLKHTYSPENGTWATAVNNIVDKSMEDLSYYIASTKFETEKCKSKYLKCPVLGYTYKKIKEIIDNQNLVILNMHNDGRDFYKDHSVTVIGYYETELTNSKTGKTKNVNFLKVYDNWSKAVSFVDFDCISRISSINWINIK